MRDLALPTLGTATGLIAIYAAGLFFVAQHVADHYTPLLYPVVFRRIGLLWLTFLGIITLGSLATALISVSSWTNVSDAVMLLAAVVLTILGLYRTFQGTADRKKVLGMVSHLNDSQRMTALRDLMWNSVNRGDVTSAEFLFDFSPYGSVERADLIDWTTQYSPLLEQPWLRQAILRSLTSGDFDENAAKLMEPALKRLVINCLDREWYEFIHEIIIGIIRAVCLTSRFTQYHRYAIFDLGFNLHFVGEEGSAATPRSSQRSPDSLEDARDLFLSHITLIRHAVVGDNDPGSVTEFCVLLERFAEYGIGSMAASSQIWEVLEDSYESGLVEQDALEALANTIGWYRNNVEEISVFEDGNDYLDRVSAHLALYIVASGRVSQLGRMMGNARFHPKQLPSRFVMTNELGEEIYAAVAKELGYKSWPNPDGRRSIRRPRRRLRLCTNTANHSPGQSQ